MGTRHTDGNNVFSIPQLVMCICGSIHIVYLRLSLHSRVTSYNDRFIQHGKPKPYY